MKEIDSYITEKLRINKDTKIYDNSFLVLYKYDFDKEEFIWDAFDSFDDTLDAVDKHGEVYDVYTNVPNDKHFIHQFLDDCIELKLGYINVDKFNSIMSKKDIKAIGGDTILGMAKKRRKRLNREK